MFNLENHIILIDNQRLVYYNLRIKPLNCMFGAINRCIKEYVYRTGHSTYNENRPEKDKRKKIVNEKFNEKLITILPNI